MTRVTIIAFDAGVGRSYIATDTVSVDRTITRRKKFMHRQDRNWMQKTIGAPIREGALFLEQ